MPKLTFETSSKTIEVEENSNILRMSIQNEGSIPYKCGAGMCGTCLVKIVDGIENTSKVMKKEIKKLGEEKIAEGYRLACQTFITGDVCVAWEEKEQAKVKERRMNAAQ